MLRLRLHGLPAPGASLALSVWHAQHRPHPHPQIQGVLSDLDDIVETNLQEGDKVKGSRSSAYPGLGKTTMAVTFGAESTDATST